MIRRTTAVLILSAFIFALGCGGGQQATPDTPANTPVMTLTPTDTGPPVACEVDAINTDIRGKIDRNPVLKEQRDAGKFKLEAKKVSVTTTGGDGSTETREYIHLVLSGKLSGDNSLEAINGIIQPFTKRPNPQEGPCVTGVRYNKMEASAESSVEDGFLWTECPDGMQVCPGGVCKVTCTGRLSTEKQ